MIDECNWLGNLSVSYFCNKYLQNEEMAPKDTQEIINSIVTQAKARGYTIPE
jgi:hypothetical protein